MALQSQLGGASLGELREAASRLLETLPWQRVADSPTVKHYTDWRLFERILEEGEEAEARVSLEEGEAELYSYRDAPEALKRLLASTLEPDEGRLAAAHYSRLREPYFLRLTGGSSRVRLSSRGRGWASVHLVAHVEPGANAVLVVEDSVGDGSSVVEVVLGPGARLELAIVASPPPGAAHALLTRRAVAGGAELSSATIARGSAMHRVEERSLLLEGARIVHRTAAVARGSERLDAVFDVIHEGASSWSDARVYGFALDESLVVARGVASIREQARRSGASFEAEVLILGEKARGYSMPLMEIDTGDVEQASHHAAQYRVSSEHLFYLETRGLSEKEALQLILAERLRTSIQHLEGASGLLENRVEEMITGLL